MSYGQYRRLLATCREQADRRAAYEALYDTYGASLNTYAALYNGVMQREWFEARARGYETHARRRALRQQHPDQRRREPDSGNQGRRRAVPALSRAAQARARARRTTTSSTRSCRWSSTTCSIRYEEVLDWIIEAVAPLGADYQARVREAFDGRWIDVYENQGKRSGAYSAPVYGAHPYMLLNYNDTLDAVFTLAHEMGHSIHTLLSHETQPFVYAGYTIFVAEVPSTLSEALLLELLLERAKTREERVVLLQHAIDGIVGHVLQPGAVCRLRAAGAPAGRARPAGHRARCSTTSTRGCSTSTGATRWRPTPRARTTWARIPHFFQSPYYVYQYATCFASTARLMTEVRQRTRADRAARPWTGICVCCAPAAATTRCGCCAGRRRSQRAVDGARRGRAARRPGDAPRSGAWLKAGGR